ncbi:MAG: hypothetical protein GY822_17775 [Deltaproteobacteria bacterium]|nr:hypothetical protein [Deltaproteobacteria bacterium]
MGASTKPDRGFPASLEKWLSGGQIGLPSRSQKPIRVQARCPTETFPAPNEYLLYEVRFKDVSIGRVHAHSLLHMVFQSSFSDGAEPPTFRDVLIRDEGALTFLPPMGNAHFAELWRRERERVEVRFADPSWQDELNCEGLLPHLLAFTPDDTGWLKVKTDQVLRLFAIVDGHVSWAMSSGPDEDMLSILMESEKLTEEQLSRALAVCGPTQIARGLIRTNAFLKDEMQGLYEFVAQRRIQKALGLTAGKVRFDHDESARPSRDPRSLESRVQLCLGLDASLSALNR